MLMGGQFDHLRADLADMQINLNNTVSENGHVPKIDRHIQTNKERTCCIYTMLPFNFPPPDGVSDSLSPRTIVIGHTIKTMASIPIPEDVINRIHVLACRNSMPNELAFADHDGIPVIDPDDDDSNDESCHPGDAEDSEDSEEDNSDNYTNVDLDDDEDPVPNENPILIAGVNDVIEDIEGEPENEANDDESKDKPENEESED
eukprot:scaffold40805_cov73-Attheya_sp.AAC.2